MKAECDFLASTGSANGGWRSLSLSKGNLDKSEEVNIPIAYRLPPKNYFLITDYYP